MKVVKKLLIVGLLGVMVMYGYQLTESPVADGDSTTPTVTVQS